MLSLNLLPGLPLLYSKAVRRMRLNFTDQKSANITIFKDGFSGIEMKEVRAHREVRHDAIHTRTTVRN